LPELLQLTPDQEARFRATMAESRKQLDALRSEQAPKIEAIRSETNRKLSSILNEEQRKKFAAFLKEMENRRRRSPRGRGLETPP
jgi:Spy/CpxP family protein refolding chaperone